MDGAISENNMVDGYNLGQAGTMSAEEFAQQQQLNRQQQMAALLMQQGQKQAQGQMIGNRYVPASFFQNITPLVQTALGAYMGNKADTEAAKLAQAIRQNKGDVEQQIINKMMPQPARAEEMAGPAYKGVAPTIQYPEQAADFAGALKMAQMNPYNAGKEYIPSILKQMMPEPTTLEREWKAAQAQGYTGTINDFKNQMSEYQKVEAANAKARLGLEGARFGLEKDKFALEMSGGKPTESQAKAGLYRSQMVSATNELNNLYEKGFDPSKPVAQAQTSLAGGAFNIAASPEARQAKQAQNQWTEAYLRFKTGAGTNASEIELNRKTYFPTAMDDAATIDLKSRMRHQAEQDMAIAAGPTSRFGAQAIAPTPSSKTETPASKQQTTPSLWGKATVVGG
jgi:hypothetical protein